MAPDLPEWHGWYFVGQHLVTPTREKVSAHVLAHLITMHRIRVHFESVEGLHSQATRAKRKRHQGAQQTVRVIVVELGAWRSKHGLGCA